jgi:hypothetical protein
MANVYDLYAVRNISLARAVASFFSSRFASADFRVRRIASADHAEVFIV